MVVRSITEKRRNVRTSNSYVPIFKKMGRLITMVKYEGRDGFHGTHETLLLPSHQIHRVQISYRLYV